MKIRTIGESRLIGRGGVISETYLEAKRLVREHRALPTTMKQCRARLVRAETALSNLQDAELLIPALVDRWGG